MNTNNLSTFHHKTKLKKVDDKYFLPFEIWNYLDFGLMFALVLFFIYASSEINIIFISMIVIFGIRIITTIKDRFFVEIKTSKSLSENINLIKKLAQRQHNLRNHWTKKVCFFLNIRNEIFFINTITEEEIISKQL